jgi:hypothetical protein
MFHRSSIFTVTSVRDQDLYVAVEENSRNIEVVVVADLDLEVAEIIT